VDGKDNKLTCVGGDADHQPKVNEVEGVLRENRIDHSVSVPNIVGRLRSQPVISAMQTSSPRIMGGLSE
jgi:hypothetical protein